MFGIQLDELGENRHMMSIVSALTGCKYDTFLEAFEALQIWVAQQSNRKYQGLETAFNAWWHHCIMKITTSGVMQKISPGCAITRLVTSLCWSSISTIFTMTGMP